MLLSRFQNWIIQIMFTMSVERVNIVEFTSGSVINVLLHHVGSYHDIFAGGTRGHPGKHPVMDHCDSRLHRVSKLRVRTDDLLNLKQCFSPLVQLK